MTVVSTFHLKLGSEETGLGDAVASPQHLMANLIIKKECKYILPCEDGLHRKTA